MEPLVSSSPSEINVSVVPPLAETREMLRVSAETKTIVSSGVQLAEKKGPA